MNHPEQLLIEKAEEKLRQNPGLIMRQNEASIKVEVYYKSQFDEFMQYRYTVNFIALWNDVLKKTNGHS